MIVELDGPQSLFKCAHRANPFFNTASQQVKGIISGVLSYTCSSAPNRSALESTHP